MFSEFVSCLNGLHNSKDPRDYSWKELEIETLEETSKRDVKLEKGEKYVETCEDDEDD